MTLALAPLAKAGVTDVATATPGALNAATWVVSVSVTFVVPQKPLIVALALVASIRPTLHV